MDAIKNNSVPEINIFNSCRWLLDGSRTCYGAIAKVYYEDGPFKEEYASRIIREKEKIELEMNLDK